MLRNIPQPVPPRFRWCIEELDPSLARIGQAEDQLQHRGLSRSVGTYQGDELPLVDVKRCRFQNRSLGRRRIHIGKLQDYGFVGWCASSCCSPVFNERIEQGPADQVDVFHPIVCKRIEWQYLCADGLCDIACR